MALTSLNKIMNNRTMDKKDIFKAAAGLVVGFAAEVAVAGLFKVNMIPKRGFINILTKLGVFVIGMKVGEDAEEYFYKMVDDAQTALKEAKEEVNKEAEAIINEEKDIGGH